MMKTSSADVPSGLGITKISDSSLNRFEFTLRSTRQFSVWHLFTQIRRHNSYLPGLVSSSSVTYASSSESESGAFSLISFPVGNLTRKLYCSLATDSIVDFLYSFCIPYKLSSFLTSPLVSSFCFFFLLTFFISFTFYLNKNMTNLYCYLSDAIFSTSPLNFCSAGRNTIESSKWTHLTPVISHNLQDSLAWRLPLVPSLARTNTIRSS